MATAETPSVSVPSNVIIPPPDIRNIVDKTASFVARNGVNLQERIREKERGNQKFAFLTQTDPYHVYYQWRLSECKSAVASAATPGGLLQIDTSNSSASAAIAPPLNSSNDSRKLSKIGDLDTSIPMADQDPSNILSGANANTGKPSIAAKSGLLAGQSAVPVKPQPFEFMQEIPPISVLDYDIIKLTALFTAKNGTAFINQLSVAESRNNVFSFIKPSHPLFGFYLRLVEQYQRVLAPKSDVLKLVEGPGKSKKHVIARIVHRAEYARWLEAQKRHQEEEREKERHIYSSIDWNDFQIVDTIEITEGDLDADLPAPTTQLELQRAALQQRRKGLMLTSSNPGVSLSAVSTLIPQSDPADLQPQSKSDDASNLKENEDDISENQASAKTAIHAALTAAATGATLQKNLKLSNAIATAPLSLAQTPVLVQQQKADTAGSSDGMSQIPKPSAAVIMPSKTLGPMKIKAGPITRKQKVKEITQICPRCGMAVPVSEMEEHMRIELLDPKWREQRELFEQARRETNLSRVGEQVVSSIKAFAERRFTGDEFDFQKKLTEDLEKQKAEAKKKIIWDGHTASIATATQKIKEFVPIDQQIASIHKAKGLIDNPANQMLPAAAAPPSLMVKDQFSNYGAASKALSYHADSVAASVSLPSKPHLNTLAKLEAPLEQKTQDPEVEEPFQQREIGSKRQAQQEKPKPSEGSRKLRR